MLKKLVNRLEKITDLIKSPFLVILPNSREIKIGSQYGDVPLQIIIKTKKALNAILSGQELKISESYIYGDIILDEKINMLKLLELKNSFLKNNSVFLKFTRIISLFNSQIAKNKQFISQHYEYDTNFFLSFLDKTRSYSQGIFLNDDELLEQASTRKLEFAMNSCQLKRGDKILDIGSGWGNVVEYFGNGGLHVDAMTIAEQSKIFVSNLIKEKQLINCRVFKKDFLTYKISDDAKYDAIVSLGTLEHLPNYKEVLRQCDHLLKKGGYAYFDASASTAHHATHSDFIERYIFPGNHTLLNIYNFIKAVRNSPFEIISLHNDTYNYYLTLKCWAENLDLNKEMIIDRWGEIIYKKFQLYLWGCCYSMKNNEIHAYRIVLRKFL